MPGYSLRSPQPEPGRPPPCASSRAWTDDGGYVLGLAPSARAASELSQAIEARTETLAKLTWTLKHQPRSQWPGWVDRIGGRTLIVIDEAGQAATPELATAVDFIVGRGGSVRLVGDDQQLAAVRRGRHPPRHRPDGRRGHPQRGPPVRRPAEAAATLALRDGDPTALGFYAENRRIHVGELGTVADQAYSAWAADRAAGRRFGLARPDPRGRHRSQRTRPRRPAHHLRTPRGREVRLADGTRASARRRHPHPPQRTTSGLLDQQLGEERRPVERREGPSGRVDEGPHLDHQRSVTLPAGYVAEHVQLGYAATAHTAQGMTCDTAHLVVTGDDSRQLVYVGLSRGRQANNIYLAEASDGDLGSLLRPDAVRPPTAIEVLTGILERDGAQQSATTIQRDLDSPATQLRDAVARYRDALGYAAEEVVGTDTLTSLDRQVEAIWPALTCEPAYPTLRSHLALGAVSGADPLRLLVDAAAGGELDTAHDRAAVLYWRLDKGAVEGPLPWLPAVPSALDTREDWGPYLQARADRITHLTGDVRSDLTTWLPLDLPIWTADITAADDPELRADLAVWRAAFGVGAADDRPTGPPQQGIGDAAHQSQLNRRLRNVVEDAATPGAWRTILPEAVRADPYAENLQRRLTILDRAGVDASPLIEDALAHPQPLPVDHAAGALWWRVVHRVDPAALRQTSTSASPQGQPSAESRWICQLTEAMPGIETNPGWPRLLKTVAAAHADGYEVPRSSLAHSPPRSRPTSAPQTTCVTASWPAPSPTPLRSSAHDCDSGTASNRFAPPSDTSADPPKPAGPKKVDVLPSKLST
ncbi:MAG: AAA family ATPase [Nocardioidaceae bacterium]